MSLRKKKASNLKDGYYLEVFMAKEHKYVLIHRNTRKEFDAALKQYEKTKDVRVVGRVKDGELSEIS